MEYFNNLEKIEKLKDIDNYYVIADFDHTLTTIESDASYGVVPKFMGGEILEERTKIYKHYRPLELDYTIEQKEKEKIMQEWAIKSFTLISKYITEDIIESALETANLYLRPGVKEFLEDMYNKNITVVIMSAGIGNIIEKFLKKQDVLYSNIILISNFFEFKDGKAKIDVNNIISTSNKNYTIISDNLRKNLEKKDKIILFGDIIEDMKMVGKEQIGKTITIGLLDSNIDNNLKVYNENYDIVVTNQENFNNVVKKIIL